MVFRTDGGSGRLRGVARRAAGFEMTVLGYDVSEPTPEELALPVRRASLDELIAQSDYISLHIPLNVHTQGMIGANQFAMMKRHPHQHRQRRHH